MYSLEDNDKYLQEISSYYYTYFKFDSLNKNITKQLRMSVSLDSKYIAIIVMVY